MNIRTSKTSSITAQVVKTESVNIQKLKSASSRALAIQLEEIGEEIKVQPMAAITALIEQINNSFNEEVSYQNQSSQGDVEAKFAELRRFQTILADMARRVIFRENAENRFLDNHYRNAVWRRVFARWKFFAQWQRYEKRMLRVWGMKNRQFTFRKVLKGWRDQVYKSKREAYNIANTKRCELEVAQLVNSKSF